MPVIQNRRELERSENRMLLWLFAALIVIAVLAYATYARYYDTNGYIINEIEAAKGRDNTAIGGETAADTY